jgi:Protein of unknown function (DUF2889)
MPLAPTPHSRKLLHTRSIQIQAFERDDALLDLEAHLTDVKPFDAPLTAGVRAAGQPVHDMWLRVTVDMQFNVVMVEAQSDAVPYTGYCESIAPDYKKLVGANLLRGFRNAVKDRMGATHGCTHLSELCAVLPTAAVQALAGKLRQGRAEARPFQIDRCHALASDGRAVQKYYPQWYRSTPRHSNEAPR